MADEWIKCIKNAFSEDGVVKMLRKVKLINDDNQEQDFRSVLNDCNEKYEYLKAAFFHTYGAATDATNTFLEIMLNKTDGQSATQTQQITELTEDTGPHLSPEIRDFIAKYDKFNIDIDKVDQRIGLMKKKSKCMLEDIGNQAKKVQNAAGQASRVFATSLSERIKEDKKE